MASEPFLPATSRTPSCSSGCLVRLPGRISQNPEIGQGQEKEVELHRRDLQWQGQTILQAVTETKRVACRIL